jgi:plastocyanin
MGRKFSLILIIIVLLALVSGYAVYTHKASAPTTEVKVEQKVYNQEVSVPTTSSSTVITTASSSQTNAQEQGHYSSGDGEVTPDIMVYEIVFDGKTFAPNSQEIKVGDVVMFTNKTNSALKVVSNNSKTSSTTPSVSSPGMTPDVTQFSFSKPGTWQYMVEGNNKIIGQLIVKP